MSPVSVKEATRESRRLASIERRFSPASSTPAMSMCSSTTAASGLGKVALSVPRSAMTIGGGNWRTRPTSAVNNVGVPQPSLNMGPKTYRSLVGGKTRWRPVTSCDA